MRVLIISVFAALPSLERQIRMVPNTEASHVIVIDLTSVCRIETSVVRYLERQRREYASQPHPISLILAGFNKGSGVHADLLRGGIVCHWIGDSERCEAHIDSPTAIGENSLTAFCSLKEALQWIKLPGAGL